MGIFILIAIGVALVFINLEIENSGKRKQQKEDEQKRKHMEEHSIPEDASLLCCTSIVVNQIELEGNREIFSWKDNNILYLCGTHKDSNVRKISIPIKDIKFYTRNGDYRVDTIVEGGGVNVGGAIVGSVVAGGVGALLAGREKITTTNKEIDDRNTYLYYSENNQNKRMVFTSKGYKELLKLIPEKEIRYIENNKIVESSKYQKDNDNVYKDIERLAELKDKGILTEEEFNQKKQLLLDKIQ